MGGQIYITQIKDVFRTFVYLKNIGILDNEIIGLKCLEDVYLIDIDKEENISLPLLNQQGIKLLEIKENFDFLTIKINNLLQTLNSRH